MNIRIRRISLCIVALFASIGARAGDLQSQIEALIPRDYWPLENSFRGHESASRQFVFKAYEQDGASTTSPGGAFYTADYFPMTPAHMSVAPESNGLWFGETSGDLSGAKRYLSLTATETAGQDPLSALKMDTKTDWTLHILAAPDPDPSNQRGAEVLFFAGYLGSSVEVLIDAHATGTTVQVRRVGRGFTNGPQTIVNEASPGDRHWYQIVVRYRPHPGGVDVKGLSLDVTGKPSVWGQSNQWLLVEQNSAVYAGKGLEDQYFHGALHHLALWSRSLSDAEVSSLQSSLREASAPVPPVTVGQEDPRFLLWTVPTSEQSLSGRNAKNWRDPIWDIPGVYPLVRFNISNPHVSAGMPPGYAPQATLDAEATAGQSYAWIKYIDSKLQEHAEKSLNDGPGYSLLWNRWGAVTWSGSTDTGYYQDFGASRGLMQNWRDTPSVWRHRSHATVPTVQDRREISIPFYREGMSQNAFRSVAIFRKLNELLEADPSLSKPTRLHFDVEGNTNLTDIGDYLGSALCSSADSTAGWLCGAMLDPRARDFEAWGVKYYWGRQESALSPCIATASTLDGNGVASPAYWGEQARTLSALLGAYTPTISKWNPANACFREEFTRFSHAQYQYAIDRALRLPAQQELNSQIRVSEYAMMAIGDSMQSAFYGSGRQIPLLGEWKLRHLDYSAPVLYPPLNDMVENDYSLVNWQGYLGLGYSLFDSLISDHRNAPAAVVREALDNLYVEIEKHNLDIAVEEGQACAPIAQAPWFPYPTFSQAGLLYANLPTYVVQWQEVARLAAFAYRRGVREFLMFADDAQVNGSTSGTVTALQGLEYIIAAVNNVKANPLDFTTAGALDRSHAAFGVPDGIVDVSDRNYYLARYAEQDREADIVTAAVAGECDLPDGTVTDDDRNAFLERITPYLQ